MKRYLSFLLFSVCLSLTACGNNETNEIEHSVISLVNFSELARNLSKKDCPQYSGHVNVNYSLAGKITFKYWNCNKEKSPAKYSFTTENGKFKWFDVKYKVNQRRGTHWSTYESYGFRVQPNNFIDFLDYVGGLPKFCKIRYLNKPEYENDGAAPSFQLLMKIEHTEKRGNLFDDYEHNMACGAPKEIFMYDNGILVWIQGETAIDMSSIKFFPSDS